MRRLDVTQAVMFSYRTLEERIPDAGPAGTGGWTSATWHADFEAMYASFVSPLFHSTGTVVAGELIQTLYTIRSERQLVQHIDITCLTVVRGLDMDDPGVGSLQLHQEPGIGY